jgi:hypothetical protein
VVGEKENQAGIASGRRGTSDAGVKVETVVLGSEALLAAERQRRMFVVICSIRSI